MNQLNNYIYYLLNKPFHRNVKRFFYLIQLYKSIKLKIMKKILLLGLFGFIVSCSNVQNSEYEGNLEIAKETLKLLQTFMLMKLNFKVHFMVDLL